MKVKRFHELVIVILIVLLAVAAAGCGASKSQELSGSARNQAGSADTSPSAGTAVEAVSLDRKIIRNANLDLRVADVPQTMERIAALCAENGGYTVNSHISRDEQRFSARLSIKVPEEKLDGITASISQLGEVTDKVISARDVTEEYYDAEARLKVLQAKEERLLGLMEKANNISDIISIENELGKTRGELEVLAGRLQLLNNSIDYSLIEIELVQALPGAVQAPQGTLGKALRGLVASLNSLISFAGNTVIAIFVILPWALVLFLLVLLSRYVYKRLRHSRIKE